MDRDNRWERTKLAYDAIVNGIGIESRDILSSIQTSYSEGITDEFIKPIVCIKDNKQPISKIENDDIVFCFNYRSDRMRQMSRVLTQEDNVDFDMKKLKLKYLTPVSYTHLLAHET